MNAAEAIYEQVLVVRCQGGDDAAFAELVDRYAGRLYYYLRKMLRDPDQADDALQDVWLAVHRHLAGMNDPRAFRAWVYRIARDRALRELRRRRSPVPLHPVDLPAGEATGHGGDGDDAFTAEDAAAVHRGLDRIDPAHREVLLLRFIEDMTYGQIAAIVGCPVGTVRSRLHYAKAALRGQLERNHRHEQL